MRACVCSRLYVCLCVCACVCAFLYIGKSRIKIHLSTRKLSLGLTNIHVY